MIEYKNVPKVKNDFDNRNECENKAADYFWDLFPRLIFFWNDNNFLDLKCTLEEMISFIGNSHNYVQIEDNMIKETNIIHFIIDKIAIIKKFDPIISYAPLLNLFLQLLVSLCDVSPLAPILLINEQPLLLFWEIILFRVLDISINSMKLISHIASKIQTEEDMHFLLPRVFELLLSEKERLPEYVTNLLPVILHYCDNAEQYLLKPYVVNILLVISELIKSEHSFIYYNLCLKIIFKLQSKGNDIFILNHDLYVSILNIIDDYGLQKFYENVFGFIDSSLYHVSDDVQKKQQLDEILEHINRIIDIFQSFIIKKCNILNLLSNLIVDNQAIIQYLITEKSINTITKYYSLQFQMRDSIIWLVWNMLYGCTSAQLNKILTNEIIFQIILESLDQDESEFAHLVAMTTKKMIINLGYPKSTSKKYIDPIINKIHDIVQDADIETQQIFFNELPQIF